MYLYIYIYIYIYRGVYFVVRSGDANSDFLGGR